jgi:hypothetical protein
MKIVQFLLDYIEYIVGITLKQIENLSREFTKIVENKI